METATTEGNEIVAHLINLQAEAFHLRSTYFKFEDNVIAIVQSFDWWKWQGEQPHSDSY